MPVGKDKIKFYFRKCIKMVFTQNYFIAICAVFWYLSSVFLLINEVNHYHLIPSLFIFFSTVLMYNLDRLFGDDWQLVKALFLRDNRPRKMRRRLYTKVMFQFFFLVPVVILFLLLKPHFIELLIVPFIVAFLYAIPLGKNEIRIRELPFVKIFAISFVWAWIGSFLVSETYSNAAALLFIERFCFIYAITIPFDLRDVEADKGKSIATIPNQIGVKLSLSSSIVALLILVFIVFVNNDTHLWLKTASAFLALLIILKWNTQRKWYYYLFLLDGCIFLQSIGILADLH